jgi:lipocalin
MRFDYCTSAAVEYECEGNACSVVTVTWEEDGQAFRVDNSSNQRVKVEVTTFAGTSSVTVEPQKSDYLRVTYFNGPYQANYEQLVSRTSQHAVGVFD